MSFYGFARARVRCHVASECRQLSFARLCIPDWPMHLEFVCIPNCDSLGLGGRRGWQSPSTLLVVPAFDRRSHRISALPICDAMRASSRSNDCSDLFQNLTSKPLRFGSKLPSLVIRESEPAITDLLPQNAILFDEVLDDVLLPLVQPAAQSK
jgi:hypothetical protein